MVLDLEKHLTFYGAYHHNPTNVAIHTIFVPLLLFTGFTMATYSGTLIQTPDWLTVPYLDLNFGTIGALVYATVYVLLEPVAGFVLAALCLVSVATGNYLRSQNPTTTFQAALGTHVFAWIAQFIGHGAFEGRAPALMDNILQAFLLAPMFVWLEILFKFGYRRELQARVDKAVQVEIAKFKSQAKKGKAQ